MKQIRNGILIIFCFILVAIISTGCLFNANNSDRVSQDIPHEYIQIIDTYQKIVEELLSGELEEKWNTEEKADLFFVNTDLLSKWNNMQIELISYSHHKQLGKKSFGYTIMDLNRDGTQELIWMLNDYTILAIFSIMDEKATLLDAYWSRYKGIILETGQLYTFSSSGAQDFEYAIIDIENKVLSYNIQFGCEEGIYYKTDGKDKIIVSEVEFEELVKKYPNVFTNNAENMKKLEMEILPLFID